MTVTCLLVLLCLLALKDFNHIRIFRIVKLEEWTNGLINGRMTYTCVVPEYPYVASRKLGVDDDIIISMMSLVKSNSANASFIHSDYMRFNNIHYLDVT